MLVGANHLFDNEGKVHKIAKIIRHPDFTYQVSIIIQLQQLLIDISSDLVYYLDLSKVL